MGDKLQGPGRRQAKINRRMQITEQPTHGAMEAQADETLDDL
jgi:hypothetical protein